MSYELESGYTRAERVAFALEHKGLRLELDSSGNLYALEDYESLEDDVVVDNTDTSTYVSTCKKRRGCKLCNYLESLLSEGFTTSNGFVFDVDVDSQLQINVRAQYANLCKNSVSSLTAYSDGETIAVDDVRVDEYGVAFVATTAGTTSGDTLSADTGITWEQNDDDYFNWTSEYRTWTDYNNVVQSFSTAQSFITEAKEINSYCSGQIVVKQGHKTALKALTTNAEVEAYDYTTGWLDNDNS